MCFSATASFTAGVSLLIVGVMTISRVRNRKDLLYALIPMLFAIQQLIEGAMWLTFPAKAPLLKMVLTYAYSVFSHVLWPMYIPIAVLLLEPTAWRRKVLIAISVSGTFIGLYLLYFLVRFSNRGRSDRSSYCLYFSAFLCTICNGLIFIRHLH